MNTIKKIIDKIISVEGGYVNHKADRGGPTKFGITLKTYSSWAEKQCSIEELKLINEATAHQIYYKRYYNKPGINKLPEELWFQMLDCSINHGPSRAIKLLQKTINSTFNGVLSVDGRLGNYTLGACAHEQYVLGDDLNNNLVDRRIKFYCKIVRRDKTQSVFLRGWLKRADSFRLSPIDHEKTNTWLHKHQKC